jgi:hypothetical protein
MRIISDTAGVHPILFHLRTLLHAMREPDTIQIDSFGGYESFERWVSRITTEDLIVISSSTSGALERKIRSRVSSAAPDIVTLFYLAGHPESDDKEIPLGVLCDLTYRGVDEFGTSGILTAYFRRLEQSASSSATCVMCAQRVPVLQLEGDSFMPRPDGLDLRMVTVKALDRSPIDPRDTKSPKVQHDFFEAFYGLDVVHMKADDRDDQQSSRRQFRTSISHLLDDSLSSANSFREELLRIRGELEVSLRPYSKGVPISVFVATEDGDSVDLARWFADKTFEGGYTNPGPRIFARRGVTLAGDGFASQLSSIPDGALVVGISSVVSTGRALLDLSRSLRVAPSGVTVGFLTAIGHPPSNSAWQILLKSLRWTAPENGSDLRYGWLLERDPMDINARTPWMIERELALDIASSEPAGSSESKAAVLRAEAIAKASIDARSLFVAPDYDGSDENSMRPINRGFIAWDFDHSLRERLDGLVGASQIEVFVAMSFMLHRSRFSNVDTATGRLSSRLPGFALDPANFDRYNDPQIQSAILRAAHPRELDYRMDEDGSRAMTEVILYSLANRQKEGGAAAAEFVIALAAGMDPDLQSGLRLREANLRELVRRIVEITSTDDRSVGPYMRGMMRLLTKKFIDSFGQPEQGNLATGQVRG